MHNCEHCSTKKRRPNETEKKNTFQAIVKQLGGNLWKSINFTGVSVLNMHKLTQANHDTAIEMQIQMTRLGNEHY